jgi:hypothetical protein
MIHKIAGSFDMRDTVEHGWLFSFIAMLMLTKATIYKALSKCNNVQDMLLEILYATL